eukprot:906274-Alexandrium_andersonii.AAC.1
MPAHGLCQSSAPVLLHDAAVSPLVQRALASSSRTRAPMRLPPEAAGGGRSACADAALPGIK